jgi:acyl-coenzyme A thioesterase PaaI-like protein
MIQPFHSDCFACGHDNPDGLQMNFAKEAGLYIGKCRPGKKFQSYGDRIHGGILSTMLDATMLYAVRHESSRNPLTIRLDVRYRHAVAPDEPIEVRAAVVRERGKVRWVEASLMTQGRVCATAKGTFSTG